MGLFAVAAAAIVMRVIMISVRLIRPAQMSGQRSVSGNAIHRQLERLIAQALHMTRIGNPPRFHGCFSMKPIPMPRRRLKVKIVRMGRMKLGREINSQMQRVKEKMLTTPKRVPINTARSTPRRCKKNFGIGSIGDVLFKEVSFGNRCG